MLPTDLKTAATPAVAVSEMKPITAAPPGFKLVKVKKPDGTIVTVKRPITQDAKKPSSSVPGQVAVPKPVATPQINQASITFKSITDSTPAPAATATATTAAKTTASEASKITAPVTAPATAPATAPKTAPQSVPAAPVTSPQNEITPKATVPDLPNTASPTPLPTKAKELPAATSEPAKKKWYSGISKGVSSLNVDKIVTALDSIEQAATRIDAALTGSPIPPKKAAPSTSAATVAPPKPVAPSSPAPKPSTIVVTNAIAKSASTEPPGASTILVSTQSQPAKANPQASGSIQPIAAISKAQAAPVAPVPATQATKTQASPVPVSVVQTRPPTAQTPRTIAQASHPAEAKAEVPSTTSKAAAPRTAPTPADRSVAPAALLATVGTAATIGTSAAVHNTQKPAAGHAPTTRSIPGPPPSAQQSQHPIQNPTPYPPTQPGYSGYQNDTIPDHAGNDYTGLAAGAVGGAALGLGGDMAYEEYEEYQSGDEVVEGDLEDGGAPAEIDEAGEAGDEVLEDYNPDEDEIVGDDAVDEAGVEGDHESEEVLEDYDPEQDEVLDDDPEHGEPVESDVGPAVEDAQADLGLSEEPDHQVAEENEVDATQEHDVDTTEEHDVDDTQDHDADATQDTDDDEHDAGDAGDVDDDDDY